jgi:DNA polymerase (family 10)
MSGKRGRFDREFALLVGRIVARKIDPLIQKLAFAGSYRRRLPDCGDIDIVVIPKPGISQERINSEAAKLCHTDKLDSSGSGLSVGTLKPELAGQKDPFEVPAFNLFFTTEPEWGAMLMFATGSGKYNAAYRAIAKKRGLKVNEYGVFVRSTNKLIPDSSFSEHAVCRTIGIPFLEPQNRIDKVFPE